MARTKTLSVLAVLVLAACGGGGGTPDPIPVVQPPPAPTGASAMPANGQAAVSWTTVPTATSYNVYTSPTSPVTKSAAKTTAATSSATLSSLANGSPVYVAVAAVNAGGESDLSNEACAVPTAASTTGLTLHDPLCAGTLNGMKWRMPFFSRGVVNGALVMSAEASNMQPPAVVGAVGYQNRASLNFGTQRVTMLRATVNVPAASVVRSGTAEASAGLALTYLPPANRMAIDNGGGRALLRIQVGLIDGGNGLRASRRVLHCDNGTCTSMGTSGIAFTDPVGFDSSGEAAASYDTIYTVTVQLDESTGVFSWTIAGGAFGAGVTGNVDPAVYLGNDASWSALGANPLTSGFFDASLRVRVEETSNTGGSRAAISATFDNVDAGLNNGAATRWDDFSGSNGNSGPTELSVAKWLPAGRHSMAQTAGALAQHSQLTSPATGGATVFNGVVVRDPSTINTVQADFTVASCANTSASGTNRASLEANIYNDGSAGTTAPNVNQPGSIVGDVRAYLFLDCVAQAAKFQVLRWDSNTPLTSTLLSDPLNNNVPMGASPLIGNVHSLRMGWDPVARLLTFQVDGQTPVVVDPTTANARMRVGAPYVKAPNTPLVQIGGFLGVFSASSTASMDFRVNNVFTAP